MKKTLTTICLLASLNCFAQKDYCKDCKTTTDEMTGLVRTEAPQVGPNRAHINLVKYKKGDIASNQLMLIFNNDYSNYRAKGVFLKLGDGTIIKNENEEVHCSMNDLHSFMFIGHFVLDSDQIEALSTKKVVKYRVDDMEKDLSDKDAIKLMAYMKCMFGE